MWPPIDAISVSKQRGLSRSEKAHRVQSAINEAAEASKGFVYLPEEMLGYDPTIVTFEPGVRMLQEGGTPDWYDARAYGFIGNGSADDARAITAAADAAGAAGGGRVFVPTPAASCRIASDVQVIAPNVLLHFAPGEFVIEAGSRIVVSASNCAVVGEGWDTVFDASANTTSTPPLRSEAPGTRWADFKVVGSRGAGGGAAPTISNAAASDLTVEKVWSLNAGSQAISLSGDRCRILDCRIDAPARTGVYIASGSNGVLVQGCDCTRPNRDAVAGNGFVAIQGNRNSGRIDRDFRIIGNSCSGAIGNVVIVFNGGSPTERRLEDVVIVGNSFVEMESDNRGGTEGEAVSATCSGLVVVGNYFRRIWNEAVNWTSPHGEPLRGFTCVGNYIEDATLEAGSINLGNGAAIEVITTHEDSVVEGFTIASNVAVDTRGTPKTRAVISVNQVRGTIRDGKISGNQGRGMTTGEVELGGSPSVTINGLGAERADAETPTASRWAPGDMVDFTDTGDGSGDGQYLLLQDGATWSRLG